MQDLFLIEDLKKGSEKAFEKVVLKYKNLIFFIINNIVCNRLDSEELTIDAFEKIYKNIRNFDGKNFKAWISKIAKNIALNHLDNKSIDISYDDEIVNKMEYIDNSNDHLDELYDKLKEFLNEDEFNVLILSSVYDMKYKDIAIFLDKPVGTISWLYSQAKKKAKANLKI